MNFYYLLCINNLKSMEPQRTLTALLKIALDGRTNRWLSKKTGIQESEISRIVSGRLIPTEKQLEKIRAAFPYQVNF